MSKQKLFGLTFSKIQLIVKDLGLPAFTAKQIADWLYKKQITSIDEMSNLSKATRQALNEKYEFGLVPPAKVQESVDGTKKYLFPIGENKFVEAAYIPDDDRFTLCVSTQVGCKMGCLFCMTGKQGFQGNLSANEILNQIRSIPEFDKLTNIVYMGMGEPLDNLKEVLNSLEIINSEYGYGWSPRRITVSTIGILPALNQFLEKSEAHLAVSLHSPYDKERQRLMPIQSVYPFSRILEELKIWDLGRQRRVSFEYIMFKGVNDTTAHAKELVKLLSGLRCRVNLIRFHPIPGSPLQGADYETIENFQNVLKRKGMVVTLRASRGQDIFAACGLLSTKELIKNDKNEDF
jgi:23S rRNA (adenine2503-C2)-methyltransferase